MGLSIRVEGKVQGVFFRKHTQKNALALGVVGWVRNRPDGSVEILAQGPDTDAVARLVDWCRTKGSPKSRVTNVTTEAVADDPNFTQGFVILDSR